MVKSKEIKAYLPDELQRLGKIELKGERNDHVKCMREPKQIRRRRCSSGGKGILKRNSFGAAGKIMLPNEGGKHIFKNLVSCRMEIQQNLKAVWKNLENIMTIDEEMKELSAKYTICYCFFKSSLAAMEGQKRKNGAKMPSIMHTNEPNMQFLGSK